MLALPKVVRAEPIFNMLSSMPNFSLILKTDTSFPIWFSTSSVSVPRAPEKATFLVVYRDEYEDVQFLEITPLTYQLLLLLQEQPNKLAQEYLKQLALLFPVINEDVLNQNGEEILRNLVKHGVVITIF